MNDFAEVWHLLTLVDITQTGVNRGTGKERNQQRNFDTVQQVIGMLTQCWSIRKPVMGSWGQLHTKFKQVGVVFGVQHDFTQETFSNLNVWTWRFGIEKDGVFDQDKKYDGKNLLKLFNNVPVITHLDDNAVLEPPVFTTDPELQNVLLICESRL